MLGQVDREDVGNHICILINYINNDVAKANTKTKDYEAGQQRSSSSSESEEDEESLVSRGKRLRAYHCPRN